MDEAAAGQKHHRRPSGIAENVAAIADLERASIERRELRDRVSDRVSRFAGSFWFIGIHAVIVTLWILANRAGGNRPPRDPFPYPFLTFVLSLEAIFMSTFVLISENRLRKEAERRAHLDLQVNLLAEAEMTVILRKLTAIGDHLGVRDDLDAGTLEELATPTDIRSIARAVEEQIPGQASEPPEP